MDRLQVIIVTYGRRDLVVRCLESLRTAVPEGTQIHVVDNASPDGTAELVAERFPDVRLHRRRHNDGFAVANNAVLCEVTAPYVLLLNPDTEVPPGVIGYLLDELGAQPDVGVLGCRLERPDGSFDHAAKRRIPDPAAALRYFALRLAGRQTTASTYTAPDVDEHGSGEVDAVNGAFMLVRTAAVREAGLLDERFWMYGEDLDWCLRIKQAGWRVRYDGRVTVVHVKGGSAGTARSLRLNYHFHRSMALFYRKHLRRKQSVDALVIAGVWLRFCVVGAVDAVTRAVQRLRGRLVAAGAA